MKPRFAEYSGELYVDLEASGIPFFIVLTGGFTLYQFPDDPVIYLKVADIKGWYEKELKYASGKEKKLYNEMISSCDRVLNQFEAEISQGVGSLMCAGIFYYS
jgi:hypothetical protein